MDRLDALAFFIRIQEKNGVAAAGRDFGLSPATSSDWLASLENYYGAKLLNRTTRSISLTEEGRLLLETAHSLVADAQDVEAKIKLGVERLSGNIKISAPQDLGMQQVAPLLDDFMEAHPAISIELVLTDDNLDLVENGIDLAVRLGVPKDSSLMIRRLRDNRRVLCAAPAYLEKNAAPNHPDDLINHNCLVMKWGSTIDREWSFKVGGRQRTITVSGNRIANNGAQVRQWCLGGHGIALKSIFDIGDDIKEERLVELLSDYAPASQSALQLIYPGGGKLNRRVRALLDHFIEAF